MAQLKLKDLDMGVREYIDLLVTDVQEAETRTNKKYVIFTVTDGETVAKIKKWDSCLVDYEHAKNTVVTMNVKSGSYNGEVTYDTDYAVFSDADIAQFIRSVPENIDLMFAGIRSRIDNFSDLSLKGFMHGILDMHEDKLKYWAAAKEMHHALYGGLLYHMYRMGKAADAMCKIYQGVDSDMLAAGVYLHDIGKLYELDTNKLGTSEYTTEGYLLGHIAIGIEMVDTYAGKYGVSKEKALHLKHMIASHHGRKEWGAIVEPKTAEAQLLHQLDMIDSKMYVFEENYATMETHSFTKTPMGQIYKF
ncbi:MAG: HD domain-containing protein [Lachnospiraceae bacterium]|nr:HD domain-containing protein [Lachnospiraceae bacterium]